MSEHPCGEQRGRLDTNKKLLRENVRATRRILNHHLTPRLTTHIKTLTRDFGFCVQAGELQIINGNWYVTHTGLLRLARRKHCRGIHVEAVESLCDSASGRYVLKATVYPSKSSSGFVGYGDADPTNVSALVRGAEMRIAETRAVNRALRKAYGIGICSVEEIGACSAAATLLLSRPRSRRKTATAMAPATRSAIGSARSSASTSSMPNWSRPTPSTSAAQQGSGMRTANRSRASCSTWPSPPRRTAMPCVCQLNSYARPQQEVVA